MDSAEDDALAHPGRCVAESAEDDALTHQQVCRTDSAEDAHTHPDRCVWLP